MTIYKSIFRKNDWKMPIYAGKCPEMPGEIPIYAGKMAGNAWKMTGKCSFTQSIFPGPEKCFSGPEMPGNWHLILENAHLPSHKLQIPLILNLKTMKVKLPKYFPNIL